MPTYDEGYLKDCIEEAQEVQDEWIVKAVEDYQFYNGKQWDETIKAKLIAENRPALTYNILRAPIRLLTGIERKSRYNIRVLPIGEEGDDDIARLLTFIYKFVETQNNADYTISEAYRWGLMTGRGWLFPDIKYNENIYGDVFIRELDPFEVMPDPYARRYDALDARYQIRKLILTEEDILDMYPFLEGKINELPFSTDLSKTFTSSRRPTYELDEVWYKRYEQVWLFAKLSTGEVTTLKGKDDIAQGRKLAEQQPDKFLIKKVMKGNIYWAVIAKDEIIEQDESPYAPGLFPYIMYSPEFLPMFYTEKPDWVSITRDLKDPAREKNKRMSEYVDNLIRLINFGIRYEKGAIANIDELDWRNPAFHVVMNEGKFDKFEKINSDMPAQALLQLHQISSQDVREIMGINTDMLGIQQSSRESGKSIMLRQQQGYTMLAPFQDNMRVTRYQLAKHIIHLIPQIFSTGRIIRLVSPTSTDQLPEGSEQYMEMQKDIIRIKKDFDVGKYDVTISEAPDTPTHRQAEFLELMDMLKEGIIPMTPPIIKLLLKTSDISIKKELINIIDQEQQQAQQQQEQQQNQEVQRQQAINASKVKSQTQGK